MRERGVPGLSIALFTIQEMLNGVSQHLPLRAAVPESEAPAVKSRVAEKAARIGWATWRLSGAGLFGGYIAAQPYVFGAGAACLLTSLVCLIVVALGAEEPLTVAQTRVVNGLLAGVFVSLVLIVVCGALSSVLIAIGTLFGWGLLSGFAMSMLVAFSLCTLCVMTASGWVADEWFPRRLIANN